MKIPHSLSLIRGLSDTGIGEGDHNVSHGEQYLFADKILKASDKSLFAEARPWMTLDTDPMDRNALGEKLVAWSVFNWEGYLFVVHLGPAENYDKRPAYFSHARAWESKDCTTPFDPTLYFGFTEGFERPWRLPSEWRPLDPIPVPERLDKKIIEENKEIAVKLLAAFKTAVITQRSLAIAVPVEEMVHGGVLESLTRFALVALPREDKRQVALRFYTRQPERLIEQPGAVNIVFAPEAAVVPLLKNPHVTVMDGNMRIISGEPPDDLAHRYAEGVYRNFLRLPDSLIAFTNHFGQINLDEQIKAALLSVIYNLADAIHAGEPEQRAFLIRYLPEVAKRIGSLPLKSLASPQQWAAFPSYALIKILLTQSTGGPADSLAKELSQALEGSDWSLDRTIRTWWNARSDDKITRLLYLVHKDQSILSESVMLELLGSVPLARIQEAGHAHWVLAAENLRGSLAHRNGEIDALIQVARENEGTRRLLFEATAANRLRKDWVLRIMGNPEQEKALLQTLFQHIFTDIPELQRWGELPQQLAFILWKSELATPEIARQAQTIADKCDPIATFPLLRELASLVEVTNGKDRVIKYGDHDNERDQGWLGSSEANPQRIDTVRLNCLSISHFHSNSHGEEPTSSQPVANGEPGWGKQNEPQRGGNAAWTNPIVKLLFKTATENEDNWNKLGTMLVDAAALDPDRPGITTQIFLEGKGEEGSKPIDRVLGTDTLPRLLADSHFLAALSYHALLHLAAIVTDALSMDRLMGQIDRFLLDSSRDHLSNLLRTGLWGYWRNRFTPWGSLDALKLAEYWFESNAEIDRKNGIPMEEWQATIKGLGGSLNSSTLAKILPSHGKRFPWITPFERRQIADLAKCVINLKALESLRQHLVKRLEAGTPCIQPAELEKILDANYRTPNQIEKIAKALRSDPYEAIGVVAKAGLWDWRPIADAIIHILERLLANVQNDRQFSRSDALFITLDQNADRILLPSESNKFQLLAYRASELNYSRLADRLSPNITIDVDLDRTTEDFSAYLLANSEVLTDDVPRFEEALCRWEGQQGSSIQSFDYHPLVALASHVKNQVMETTQAPAYLYLGKVWSRLATVVAEHRPNLAKPMHYPKPWLPLLEVAAIFLIDDYLSGLAKKMVLDCAIKDQSEVWLEAVHRSMERLANGERGDDYNPREAPEYDAAFAEFEAWFQEKLHNISLMSRASNAAQRPVR
uniref:Uncharacterized protein n=1 Tax=Candidatus Kentrum sp. LPFa TaxID=2126335 RepID=A0A450VZL8_9GAMM|nr:MAG: hypothetical protein BECKLPF1236B_GA0070989_10135 [Candidatus Kentron sp. LPFa]